MFNENTKKIMDKFSPYPKIFQSIYAYIKMS